MRKRSRKKCGERIVLMVVLYGLVIVDPFGQVTSLVSEAFLVVLNPPVISLENSIHCCLRSKYQWRLISVSSGISASFFYFGIKFCRLTREGFDQIL